ncbi:hypothetical protein Salat_2159700 [Sesamum alatum]|uniref:Uncharacterized protein n=1 Tax=Sesamum alatum TaxID=300844 RepID=A0AAE2CHA8_9LAMI|nr:hypothetical protein Salat_2159700 [Sesamum alatum]
MRISRPNSVDMVRHQDWQSGKQAVSVLVSVARQWCARAGSSRASCGRCADDRGPWPRSVGMVTGVGRRVCRQVMDCARRQCPMRTFYGILRAQARRLCRLDSMLHARLGNCA